MNQLLLFALCQENPLRNLFFFHPWYECVVDRNGVIRIDSLGDILLIVFTIVEDLIRLALVVAAGYIFFMLFKIVLARGDTGKINQALSGIRDAVIGFVIALSAVAVVNFVGSAFR